MSETAGEYEVYQALRSELLRLIDAGPAEGLTSKALHASSELAEDLAQVARELKALQSEKLLSVDNCHRYYRRRRGGPKPAADAASRPMRSKATRVVRGKAKSRAPARKSARTAMVTAAVAEALARALTAAQEALDDYVASVCDPAVLKPLRETRDAARRACEAFAGGATPVPEYS